MEVVDFHVHLPDIFDVLKLDIEEVRSLLLREMEIASVGKAVILSLEFNPNLLMNRTSLEELFKSIEETISYGLYSLPPSITRVVEKMDKAITQHCNVLKTVYTPTERVVKTSRNTEKLFPVGSVDLSLGREVVERVYDLVRMGVIGLKFIPTLQMIGERELELLDYIVEVLEDEGKALFIHTGCDPGIWELPRYCELGNPLKFEETIKRHRDLPVILCHMGSYSALTPGIYFREAILLARKYEHVYLDTSAVDVEIILNAYEKLGAEKLVYGSDYPVVGGSMREHVTRILDLKVPRKDLEKILYFNGEAILDLVNS